MNTLNKYKGIVTGAASGIGKAVALELAKRGAVVYLVDVDAHKLDQVVQEGSNWSKLHPYVMDVTDPVEWKFLVAKVKTEQGSLDFVVNNAGISIDGEMKDMTLDLWDKILNVNLKGVIYGTQEAYLQMVKQKHGHIVNVSSLAGLIPGWMQVAYSTTKWAVLGLTKSLRPEAAAYGVKVTAVCPGIVDTNIFNSTTLLNVSREDFIQQIPFKPVPAQKAAHIIVEGMLSNQAEVVFPFHAKALKNFYRFLPGTFDRMGKKEADKFRKLIKTQQAQPA